LHNDKDQQVLFVGGPNVHKKNPRWRTDAILKTVKLPQLIIALTKRREIWYGVVQCLSEPYQQLKFQQ